MQLHCPILGQNDKLPEKYTANGADTSPPLKWDNVPKGTKEFALTCTHCVDGKRVVHWLITGITRQRRSIGEATAGGGFVGRNDFGNLTYNGPVDPPKDAPERYVFTLYALGEGLTSVGNGARMDEVFEAMEGNVLATAETSATW